MKNTLTKVALLGAVALGLAACGGGGGGGTVTITDPTPVPPVVAPDPTPEMREAQLRSTVVSIAQNAGYTRDESKRALVEAILDVSISNDAFDEAVAETDGTTHGLITFLVETGDYTGPDWLSPLAITNMITAYHAALTPTFTFSDGTVIRDGGTGTRDARSIMSYVTEARNTAVSERNATNLSLIHI